jgi:hypothetical protein
MYKVSGSFHGYDSNYLIDTLRVLNGGDKQKNGDSYVGIINISMNINDNELRNSMTMV